MQHVQRPTERQVRDWLAMLGRLVAGSMSAGEIGIRLDAYTPELMERYDSRDFDRTSREFVARNCKFFPSYGELCELLDKWPKPAAKPFPQAAESRANLSDADRAWIARWKARKAEIMAPGYQPRFATPEADLANLASLIQAQSRDAWDVISDSPRIVQCEPTEAEVEAVSTRVQQAIRGMKAARIPQSRPFTAPPKHLPDVTLHGDALRKSRAARGCSVPVPEPVPEPWPEHEEALF